MYHHAVRTVTATRYVTPFREGGSLPALVEADDGRQYVVKFRGAGQGTRALIAELVAGQLGRAAGLPVPELALVTVDAALGKSEPDQEIRELIAASVGLNLGLEFLPGSVTFDPAADQPELALASEIVAFDAFISNVDRTAKNPNLLGWHGGLWLIDHGASLIFLHGWDGGLGKAASPFAAIRSHVLLPWATEVPRAGAALLARLDDAALADAVAALPADWLGEDSFALQPALLAFLAARRGHAAVFLEEADRARTRTV